jgi:hypothetical protein
MSNAGLDIAVQERNRELLAERLSWPDGALEACRQLERKHEGYSTWWGKGWSGDPKPGFYARPTEEQRGQTLYGRTDEDLSVAIASDAVRTRARYW